MARIYLKIYLINVQDFHINRILKFLKKTTVAKSKAIFARSINLMTLRKTTGYILNHYKSFLFYYFLNKTCKHHINGYSIYI